MNLDEEEYDLLCTECDAKEKIKAKKRQGTAKIM